MRRGRRGHRRALHPQDEGVDGALGVALSVFGAESLVLLVDDESLVDDLSPDRPEPELEPSPLLAPAAALLFFA